jgi:hypothetical protein
LQIEKPTYNLTDPYPIVKHLLLSGPDIIVFKNEHWVLIWGIEKDIPKKGKANSVFLQETWRFNAAGKADLMHSFAEQPQPAKK